MSIVKDLLLFFALFLFIKCISLHLKLVKQRQYFIQVLNHDLRVSAIAQIRGLELLEKEVSTPKTSGNRELISYIIDSCKFSLDMITILLNTYKYENGEEVLKYEMSDINEIVFGVIKNSEKFLLEKNIQISNMLSNNLSLQGDYNGLVKLFSILLTTSIFYSQPNSCIRVKGGIYGKNLKVSIEYKGKSLSLEERKRMFMNNPRFSTVGHGIRMHLCKKIVDFHKGKIEVNCISSGVNSFDFVIPLIRVNASKTLCNSMLGGLSLQKIKSVM